ncbi:MAG: DUF3445 domain-containing protein [Rhodobacteraceae bacterium]|nr:DUF3445 domain-containing protein [Paracoccaceae bacterium]
MRGAVGLPGTRPENGPWLRVDEAFSDQMAVRTRLLQEVQDDVVYCEKDAQDAVIELLSEAIEVACTHLGYAREGDGIRRPDGRLINLANPLSALGHLFQNDFVVMEKRGDEHALTAAVLCFPASWSLAEKASHGLLRIHAPVASYDDQISKRVQRLFDGVQVGRPLWRFNRLWYETAELYQPRTEDGRRDLARETHFMRCERQTLVRMPKTQAVVFAIHTYVLPKTTALEQLELNDPA